MLAHGARRGQPESDNERRRQVPDGQTPWLATFLALAFILIFLTNKLGLLCKRRPSGIADEHHVVGHAASREGELFAVVRPGEIED